MGFGYAELLVIFLIVLLLFGGKKLPEIARGLGKGFGEFRKARDDFRAAVEKSAADPAAAPEPELKASAPPPPSQG